MSPGGIDGIGWMRQLIGRFDRLEERAETASVPEDRGDLLDTRDPELQPPLYRVVDILRTKPGKADR